MPSSCRVEKKSVQLGKNEGYSVVSIKGGDRETNIYRAICRPEANTFAVLVGTNHDEAKVSLRPNLRIQGS